MILINVLAMVAIAAAIVMAMLGAEGPAINRATMFRDADAALAIARGGELTAIAALRRDLATGPGSDDRTEAWAKVEQHMTPIEGGTFTLAITDAQSRFNVNAAVGAGEPQLAAITTSLGLDPDIAVRIATSIAEHGRVRDVAELARAGIDDATLARLRPFLTALPATAPVNVNAAAAPLLAVLVGDPVGGRLLGDRRDHAGKLTALDFAATGLRLPSGAGYTSDHFTVTTTVRQGATTVTLTSLIERRRGPAPAPNSAPTVVAIARWIGPPPS
jgi:general secretion pathway protein K